jgi:arabinogalactan oligomer/maltooligosaccharide transport system permease protein
VSTAEEHAASIAVPAARTIAKRRRPKSVFRGQWWRHVVGIVALGFALFPIAYIASASVNADHSLSGTSIIPREVTTEHFETILSGEITDVEGNTQKTPYMTWFANTMIVAGTTALLTVLLGALAAYAFSRFRFRGRYLGMLFLLLIQMFPQFLALVAIYLILLETGDVFAIMGLNSLSGLILVYLGGALGVNAWLMKGFFDTIPSELDESARVDGASPAQIFWGVILPLAAPILAVIGLISFVSTVNEFVIAGALLQTDPKFTLPLGMFSFIDEQYAERWGPFAAGVLIAAIPAVALFMFLQRYIVQGLTQGSVKG